MDRVYKVIVDDNKNTFWYNEADQLHRLDGPAIEHVDGHKEWYLRGIKYSEQEFNLIMENQTFDIRYWANRIFSILENFDFEKVHRVMTLLDWKWYREDETFAIPSVQDIKKRAHDMMWNIVGSDYISISSAGFRIDIDKICGQMELSFVVENFCDSQDEE